MASPRDLRRRIRSIGGTAQITKAMQMVAASKMRKAQEAALTAAPFARRLYRMQRTATTRAADFHHPLMDVRPVRRRAVILIAADKGLCGALNTNVFRLASQFDSEDDGLHHRGPQGRTVRRPERAAAGRGVRLRRLADVRRGAGHCGVCAGPLSQRRGGPGAHRRHPIRQHADAGGGHHRVSAGRTDHGPEGAGGRIGRGARGRHRRDAVRAERGVGPGIPHRPLPQYLHLHTSCSTPRRASKAPAWCR